MSSQDNGGPAFPHLQEGWTHAGAPGLSIRDYFAAHFMARAQSLCEDRGAWNEDTAAQCAYAMADAMLKARQS